MMLKKVVIVGLLVLVVLAGVGFGKEIVVTSTADSGTGSFRWALQTARSGDVITFDPEVFPPSAPATINLQSCLPSIRQGRITVDASDAGVILDGQALPPEDAWGVEISSNGNAIHGLQVVNVPGPGIVIVERASGNTIGGDRTVGGGPIGHANLCSGNNGGICMWGEGPSHNTIIGNLIGTDVTGKEPFGNIDGMFLSGGASHNVIGPDNIIAYNRENAIVVQGPNSIRNTITQNSIHNNGWGGIQLLEGGNNELSPPLITRVDWVAGVVTGNVCPNCTIEIFSDSENQGEHYEGQSSADDTGSFTFNKGIPFTGYNVTATAADTQENTSEFSVAIHAAGGTASPSNHQPGSTIVVSSTADSGPGTLRWALETAQSGDSITFDARVFPPDDPATILVLSGLPALQCGNLTIDASNAGVTIDGSFARGSSVNGLEIFSPDNKIRGLRIQDFSECGIWLSERAFNNVIGGEATQGNTIVGCNGGVVIWGEQASHNTVLGNLIGTDDTTASELSNTDGITLGGFARHNVIGPNNLIACNRETGILIADLYSSGNTITRNSIHSNGWDGIRFEVFYPSNADFVLETVDPSEGLISGRACAGCVLEFFSDTGLQGAIYEGRTTANEDGFFQLLTGAPMSGPNLTATRTDTSGATSWFLGPFDLTVAERGLQENNNSLSTPLLGKGGSSDPLWEGAGRQFTTGQWNGLWEPFNHYMILKKEILDLGGRSVRGADNHFDSISVNWLEMEWPVSNHSDEWISALVDNNISIRYCLSFWDKAGYAAGDPAPCERFTTEQDFQRYLEFVRRVVTHYADQVDSFELWNEPDVERCWQYIPIENYIELVRRTVPVLRELAPNAEVVIGSTTPFIEDESCGGYEYLMTLVESDVVALADAIAWHVGAPSPQFDDWREVYENYADLTRMIAETARANGFDGRFIADELNWRSYLNPFEGEPWVYTPVTAAKYYARGTLINPGRCHPSIRLAFDRRWDSGKRSTRWGHRR